jgi:hypothetical protein
MVTILPIDIDEDLLRDGLSQAVARNVDSALKELTTQVSELYAVGIVDRDKWNAAFDTLADIRAKMTPVLEYAKGFHDQYPDDSDDEANR